MLPVSIVGFFCEDIREEKAGTDTIIGIMPDNVNVRSIPCVFPKLGIYIRIHLDPAHDPGEIQLKLALPDGSEFSLGRFEASLVTNSIDTARAGGGPLAGLISRAVASPFRIPAAGRIRAIVTVKGTEYIAAALNVQIGS